LYIGCTEGEDKCDVCYDGKHVGESCTDIVVNNCTIVELKAARQLIADHEVQFLNHLKATNIEVGLLLNFGPQAQLKRKFYDNDRKGSREWIATG